MLPLVDDRVDRDRGLARLAVADDELALAPTDRRHRVDRLDSSLQRFLHRLTRGHAGGLNLERPALLELDGALAVDGVADRVDDPPEELVTDSDRQDLTRLLDGVSLLDLG